MSAKHLAQTVNASASSYMWTRKPRAGTERSGPGLATKMTRRAAASRAPFPFCGAPTPDGTVLRVSDHEARGQVAAVPRARHGHDDSGCSRFTHRA